MVGMVTFGTWLHFDYYTIEYEGYNHDKRMWQYI